MCYSFYGSFLPTLCLFRGRWRCGWSRACLWQIFLYFTKSIMNNACLKWLDYRKMKFFGIAYSCKSKSYSHWKYLVCSYIYLEWYELQLCNLNSRVTRFCMMGVYINLSKIFPNKVQLNLLQHQWLQKCHTINILLQFFSFLEVCKSR